MALLDNATPTTPHVFVRGNAGNQGAEVPRQMLEIVTGERRKPFAKGSGRLELAEAIASDENPLTARVIVNRVWLHHFGKGIVTTPSDFGVRSDPPSHPELLDYLAAQFMTNGWSLKKLQRAILLSSTYQQSSLDPKRGSSASAKARPSAPDQIDPENRLLWKFPRQRLDFEALRDSLLFVSGKLDLTQGGPTVDIVKEASTPRRTIYGFIDRQNLPGLFRTFDFASPDSTSPQRFQTSVPQQALFLLNNLFVIEQAKNLLKREDFNSLSTDAEKIRFLYAQTFQRAPEIEETQLALNFLKNAPVEKTEAEEKHLDPWQKLAQALLLSNEFAFVD